MKLNPDCMRDIMLFLESDLTISVYGFNTIQRIPLFEHFHGLYSYEDILYSVLQLHKNDYILTDFELHIPDSRFTFDHIYYITPKGYEFIEHIRDNERWKTVKKGASAIRDYSLSALSSIAEGVTSAAISAYLSGKANP